MRHDIDHILQFFTHKHLPEHLQAVSKPFGLLANRIGSVAAGLPLTQGEYADYLELVAVVASGPVNPETVIAISKLAEVEEHISRGSALGYACALRSLLEAKDAAVRAVVAK
jgi:hypothetical protein